MRGQEIFKGPGLRGIRAVAWSGARMGPCSKLTVDDGEEARVRGAAADVVGLANGADKGSELGEEGTLGMRILPQGPAARR